MILSLKYMRQMINDEARVIIRLLYTLQRLKNE